jgi:hypothetical protein
MPSTRTVPVANTKWGSLDITLNLHSRHQETPFGSFPTGQPYSIGVPVLSNPGGAAPYGGRVVGLPMSARHGAVRRTPSGRFS